MRVPERGIHLVFVSKGEQDNKLTPETGKKKKKKQPETKYVLVGSSPAQIRWTVKPIPAHLSIEILSFQSAFPPILSHLILTATLWERESSFPVVETEALREWQFAGNWSSEEIAICFTLSA